MDIDDLVIKIPVLFQIDEIACTADFNPSVSSPRESHRFTAKELYSEFEYLLGKQQVSDHESVWPFPTRNISHSQVVEMKLEARTNGNADSHFFLWPTMTRFWVGW